jgi:hypothetical protein
MVLEDEEEDEEPPMPEHKQRKHYGNADSDPMKDLHKFIVEQVFGLSETTQNTAILNMGAQTQCAPSVLFTPVDSATNPVMRSVLTRWPTLAAPTSTWGLAAGIHSALPRTVVTQPCCLRYHCENAVKLRAEVETNSAKAGQVPKGTKVRVDKVHDLGYAASDSGGHRLRSHVSLP